MTAAEELRKSYINRITNVNGYDSVVPPTPDEAQNPTVLNDNPINTARDAVIDQFAKKQPSTSKPTKPTAEKPKRKPLPNFSGTKTENPQLSFIERGVIKGLKDGDGDGKPDPSFWGGGFSQTFGGRSGRELADLKNKRERHERAKDLINKSGFADKFNISPGTLLDPDEVTAYITKVKKRSDSEHDELVHGRGLENQGKVNEPLLQQSKNNLEGTKFTASTNLEGVKDTNRISENNNRMTNQTDNRRITAESNIALSGLENELELAELQFRGQEAQIAAQNELNKQHYAHELEMWRGDNARDDRKDALALLISGLSGLGAAFAM